jgi:riboflavin-specific deaminase-like protein
VRRRCAPGRLSASSRDTEPRLAAPSFRTLLGELPERLDAAAIVEALPLAELAPADRPYVVVNMVETLDGRITIHGRAGPIGNQADSELFHHLRAGGDAVMAGAGTVRIEHYGRLTRDDELAALRRRLGVRPAPLAVVVSRSLSLPLDLPLLNEPETEVAVITAAEHDLPEVPARVRYLREPLPAALATLRREHGVRSIVCEGGADLNGTLFPHGLVDELWVCIAPTLAGGDDPLTILRGPVLDPPLELDLRWLFESDGYLFGRYVLP